MVKHRKILLLALLFGVATALLVNTYIERKTRLVVAGQETARVVVAKVAIPPKTVITPEMLEVKEMPRQFILPGALREPREAVGAITRGELVAGEQVLSNKLVGSKNPAEGLALLIPKGKRAVSVAVNEVSGVSGLIQPGDHVDVMATFELAAKDAAGQVVNATITNVVLQDIEVLAVGQNLTGSGTAKETKPEQQAPTVTLAVYLHQAQPLVMASEKGSVRLLLRSPVDQGTASLRAYDIRQFLSQ